MSTANIHDFLYTWNPTPATQLQHTRIEDDIRDGIQGAYARKPTLAEKKELLELSAKVGSYSILIGFPAISQQEFDDCRALVAHAQALNIKANINFLARMLVSDVEPIARLKQEFPDVNVRAELFLGVSPLRRKIESWDFTKVLSQLKATGDYLIEHKTPFGFSLEDGSRTPPRDLEQVMDVALTAGITDVAICDTVGDSTPDGAAALTEFIAQYLVKHNARNTVDIIWHGHNDKGLSVANAIASAQAGADTISGAFLGIGERTGNTPLEQVVFLLNQAGNKHHDLSALYPYCQALARYTDTSIAVTAPLIGQQAFATSAGTHSAAVLKAKALGTAFEDYVFSAVPASELGRYQDVLIGPTSGMANARYMLEQLGLQASTDDVAALLEYAKTRDRWLTSEDIQAYVAEKGLHNTAVA